MTRRATIAARLLSIATAMGICSCCCTPAVAEELRDWKLSPYRVRVTIAASTTARPEPQLEAAIAKTVAQRVDATISPLWTLDLKAAEDHASRRQCLEEPAIPWEEIPAELKAFDKLLWAGVEARADGYALRCREFDAYTRRWGPLHERFVRQASFLPEAAFQLLRQSFSPIAIVQPIADNDKQVQLIFKGCDLPKQTQDDPLVRRQDVLQPLLRRTDRSGKLMANGITEVPYTFLTTANPKNDNTCGLADVATGTRRPFAAERRAHVEQIAVALRNEPGPATVRFFSRSDKTQGLPGYEVFIAGEGDTLKKLGVTNRSGVISIPPSPGAITVVVLKSEGQLLAKAPVPNGAGDAFEIPVADSVSRLRAQAEAQVVREQLVDVVARRTIMMARIRAMLKKNKVKEAAELMQQLDELPSASIFGRGIDTAMKKVPAAKDPTVQRSIDKLFSTTRELLAKFLNNRPIIDLQSEVNSASRSGT